MLGVGEIGHKIAIDISTEGYITYLRQAAFPSLPLLSWLDILVLGVGEIGHKIAIDISTEGLSQPRYLKGEDRNDLSVIYYNLQYDTQIFV